MFHRDLCGGELSAFTIFHRFNTFLGTEEHLKNRVFLFMIAYRPSLLLLLRNMKYTLSSDKAFTVLSIDLQKKKLG